MHEPHCPHSRTQEDKRPSTAILMPRWIHTELPLGSHGAHFPKESLILIATVFFFFVTEIHPFAYSKDFVPFPYRNVNFYAPLNLMKPKVVLSLSHVSSRQASTLRWRHKLLSWAICDLNSITQCRAIHTFTAAKQTPLVWAKQQKLTWNICFMALKFHVYDLRLLRLGKVLL